MVRYVHLSRAMSQDNTLEYGPRWGFPKTANAAVRRVAFEAVGGVRDSIRAGEDAAATHAGRRTPRGLAMQWWALRFAARGVVKAARTRNRDLALQAVLEPLEQISYELGRSVPNERPLPPRSPWRLLCG